MFKDLNEAMAAVSIIASSPAVAGDPNDIANGIITDAHKYTRTLIRNDYPTLVTAQEQFLPIEIISKPIATLMPEILELAKVIEYSAQKTSNLNAIMVSITAFINSPAGGTDTNETQINVLDLLCRAWSLAEELEKFTGDDLSLRAQILDCLEGNISDQGGCMPGVIARLYPAYARMVNYALELQVKLEARHAPTLKAS